MIITDMCPYSSSFLSKTERALITGTFLLMVSRKGTSCYFSQKKIEPCKCTTEKVSNGLTLGFHPQTQKLEQSRTP